MTVQANLIKIGFTAGDEEPKGVFSCVVGKRKYILCQTFMVKEREFAVAEVALAKSDVLKMKYPIGEGIITMERIWSHAF